MEDCPPLHSGNRLKIQGGSCCVIGTAVIADHEHRGGKTLIFLIYL